MKIYLDMCAIQRPLDIATQTRIVLESEAVLGLLARCDAGQIELVSSEALIYETEQNPLPMRREHALAILAKAQSTTPIGENVNARAKEFLAHGIHPMDALHLSSAEQSQADYFCTCDDQLLQKSGRLLNLQVKVLSPVELIQEIEK